MRFKISSATNAGVRFETRLSLDKTSLQTLSFETGRYENASSQSCTGCTKPHEILIYKGQVLIARKTGNRMSKRMKATGFGRLYAHIYSVLCIPCTHACAFSYLYLADSRMTTSLAEAYQTVRLATADDLYGNTNITRHSTFTEVIRSKSDSLSSSFNSVKEHNRHLNLKNSVLGGRIQLGLCLLTLEKVTGRLGNCVEPSMRKARFMLARQRYTVCFFLGQRQGWILGSSCGAGRRLIARRTDRLLGWNSRRSLRMRLRLTA